MKYRTDDFQYLIQAESLDVTLTLSSKDELDALDRILDRLNLPNKKRAQKQEALACILANLLKGYQLNVPISYSRAKDHYRLPRKYGKRFYTYETMVAIIDRLEECGFIGSKRGFYDRRGKSFTARMWPTPKLIKLIANCDLEIAPLDELILLKGLNKEYLEYVDTAPIHQMRDRLQHYNDLMNCTQIKLVIPNGVELQMESFQDLHERKFPRAFSVNTNNLQQNINISKKVEGVIPSERVLYSDILNPIVFPLSISPYLSLSEFGSGKAPFHYSGEILPVYTDEVHYPLEHIQTYRVFNRGNFNLGGRFYSRGLRSHIGFSDELRRYLTLNGHRVVELDYSALHLRFAYHLIGQDYHGDPYGFCARDKRSRKAYKLAALILINSSSRQQAVRAIRKKFLDEGISLLKDAQIKHLIRQLEEHHSPIREFFCSDKGVEFMNLDARIMDGILTHFTAKGTPILPVHDSCVAPRHLEEHLREIMIEEHRRVMGFKPIVESKF